MPITAKTSQKKLIKIILKFNAQQKYKNDDELLLEILVLKS